MPSQYAEYNQDALDTIIDSIAENSCVAFLGPLFGEDNERNKINRMLWKYFDEKGPVVDSDFQNLFIRKIDYSDQVMATRMKTFYSTAGDISSPETGPSTFIYRNVAKINFSAFIVFGQDNFLKNAFDELGFDYLSQHYSTRGPQALAASDQGSDDAGVDNGPKGLRYAPIIYNAYGNILDPQSLITNYDSFYQFLFAMLSDKSIFSEDLLRRLVKARVFLFLGFDLKKWYVPLLVARFYTLGNPSFKSMFASSMNDTDVTNNEEYVNWLKRYPLQLQQISDTASFIDSILEPPNSDKPRVLRTAVRQAITSPGKCFEHPEYPAMKDKWLDQLGTLSPEKLPVLFDEIMSWFKGRNCKDAQRYGILKKASLSNAIEKYNAGLISDEAYDIAVTRIRAAVIKYLDV